MKTSTVISKAPISPAVRGGGDKASVDEGGKKSEDRKEEEKEEEEEEEEEKWGEKGRRTRMRTKGGEGIQQKSGT